MTNRYFNPVKIIIGRGSLKNLPELIGNRRAVLVTTSGMVKRGVVDRIMKLCSSNISYVSTRVIENPTIFSINSCFTEIWGYEYDVVIGLGGGSALDTAKVVALLSDGSVRENWLDMHLLHNCDKPNNLKSKPLIAIPTTSGSGSEVTQWATIRDDVTGTKYSISDGVMYPERALLDSELTDTLPYEITISSAFDALSHSMEAIWNKNANPVSDVMASRAISMTIPILSDNFKEKYRQREVRDKMLRSSLLAGLAFSNTKTAIAHSISYPITSKMNIPHGIACSFVLPEIMRINYRQNPDRVGIIMKALGCVSIDDAVKRLYEILIETGVSEYLRKHIIYLSNVTSLDSNYIAQGRAENNIIDLTQEDIEDIVQRSLTVLMGRYSERRI